MHVPPHIVRKIGEFFKLYFALLRSPFEPCCTSVLSSYDAVLCLYISLQQYSLSFCALHLKTIPFAFRRTIPYLLEPFQDSPSTLKAYDFVRCFVLSSYRKLAMKWHPDKNKDNTVSYRVPNQ